MKKRYVWRPKTPLQKGLYYVTHGIVAGIVLSLVWMMIAIASVKGGWM